MPAAPESSVPVEASALNHGAMDMSGMGSWVHGYVRVWITQWRNGHGDMQMQGGSAPFTMPAIPDATPMAMCAMRASNIALPPSEALIMSEHAITSVPLLRTALEYVKARGEEWAAYEASAWVWQHPITAAVIKAEGDAGWR